jgi:hypothetical protein
MIGLRGEPGISLIQFYSVTAAARAGMAQSVYRLVTCWTVWGRIVVGRDIPHQPRPIPGPTQPHVQWLPGLFPGGKAAEAWC